MSALAEASQTSRSGWRSLLDRMHEPAFWAIQVGVILISALHVALEAGWIAGGSWDALSSAHHIPVILYLVPVTYAGLVYGWEGGVLTGVWAGLLASVNVVVFNLDDYEWVIEVGFAALVLGMGVVMALPVERERHQRQRAESAVARLEALNHMAILAATSRSPRDGVVAVLERLCELAGTEDAAFVLWRDDEDEPVLEISRLTGSPLLDVAKRPALEGEASHKLVEPLLAGELPLEAKVTTGGLTASLMAALDATKAVENHEELESFLAAVANQLMVQTEYTILQEREKERVVSYLKLVTRAQEEERRRLARDLHDGPAQQLALLVRKLEEVERGTSGNGAQQSAMEILDELRRLARDQRPTMLDDLGVVPALEWLVDDSNRRTDASVSLEVESSPVRLAPETEVILYRIAQEALHNAERHADADSIDVLISFDTESVRLSIRDNGKGFRVPDANDAYLAQGRLGLMGMYERAELADGSLQVESRIGAGTWINVNLPMSPATGITQG